MPGAGAFTFEPSVAVGAHGTVGVTWSDLRYDRAGDVALTADVWFAHSGDRGTSWRQAHVAGTTDPRATSRSQLRRRAPGAGSPAGKGFAASVTLAAPQVKSGPTDIFSVRIGPG